MTTPDLPTAVMNLAKLIEGLQNFLQQMQNSQMQMQKELQEQLMEMKVQKSGEEEKREPGESTKSRDEEKNFVAAAVFEGDGTG